ncbi:MAG: hypothetical protein ACTSVL_04790, partial [Promethearchaeota archaeon]
FTNFQHGDLIILEATPFDGYEWGNSLNSSTKNILNSIPVINNINFLNEIRYTNETLSVEITASDEDNDNITFSYRWFKNGQLLVGENGSTLNFTNFQHGDLIILEATPFDGYEWGNSLNSSTKNIVNFIPVITHVSFSKDVVYSNDTLRVNIDVIDIDNDNITYTYRWFCNGTLIIDENNSSLNLSNCQSGDQIIVEVTPFDGISKGISINSTKITIQNKIDENPARNNNWLWITIPLLALSSFFVMAIMYRKKKMAQNKIPIPVIDETEEFKKIIDDEQNIRMVFITHSENSTMILNRLYGVDDIDNKSDLISGFLTAISNWGTEVKSNADQNGLKLLSWKDFSISIEHGEYINIAVVSDIALQSKEMNERISEVVKQFEILFNDELSTFSGKISPFSAFSLQIDDILKTDHQFRCKIDYEKLKNFPTSRGIQRFFKNTSYMQSGFLIIDLIPKMIEQKILPHSSDVYKLFYNLLKEKIIFPDLK